MQSFTIPSSGNIIYCDVMISSGELFCQPYFSNEEKKNREKFPAMLATHYSIALRIRTF
jgi:hypothetical protein